MFVIQSGTKVSENTFFKNKFDKNHVRSELKWLI
jgi:hypothetical protein